MNFLLNPMNNITDNQSDAVVSVIVCCYNSSETIERVLEYLGNQKNLNNSPFEVILIDNNSTDDTASVAQVCYELQNYHYKLSIITEKNPGLTNARIAGINASRADLLVFCDDDNLLDPNYIQNVIRLFSVDSQLGCIGPGVIEAVNDKLVRLDEKWRQFFQDKNVPGTNYCEGFGEPYLPAGTGMVIRKELAQQYISKVKSGIYTATDRKSGVLLSGGDTQLAYTALLSGFKVGITDQLKVFHLTTSKKLTSKYVRKMYFGCYSNHIIHCEVSPSFRDSILSEKIENIPLKTLKKAHSIGWRIIRIGKYKHFIAYLADMKGRLDVRGEKSYFLNTLIRLLDLA